MEKYKVSKLTAESLLDMSIRYSAELLDKNNKIVFVELSKSSTGGWVVQTKKSNVFLPLYTAEKETVYSINNNDEVYIDEAIPCDKEIIS